MNKDAIYPESQAEVLPKFSLKEKDRTEGDEIFSLRREREKREGQYIDRPITVTSLHNCLEACEIDSAGNVKYFPIMQALPFEREELEKPVAIWLPYEGGSYEDYIYFDPRNNSLRYRTGETITDIDGMDQFFEASNFNLQDIITAYEEIRPLLFTGESKDTKRQAA